VAFVVDEVEACVLTDVVADAALVRLPEGVADAVARLPVATGAVGCTVASGWLLGAAVQAAGIAERGPVLPAQTVTAPLTSRMATSPATIAAPVFMVRRGRTGSGSGAAGLYGGGITGPGCCGAANSGRPPSWPR
jgi:hypothetical protein